MPPSLPPPRVHPYNSNSKSNSNSNSNTTDTNTSRGTVDVNRALPPLPQIAAHQGASSQNRKTEHEATGSTRQNHTRSFSHPFPSFFGGSGRRSEKRNLKSKVSAEFNGCNNGNGNGRPVQSSDTPSRNPSLNVGSESVTGKCMTCDSTVRWPRDLKVFRCTVCLTVNDLEPDPIAGERPSGKSPRHPSPVFTVPRKPVSLSLERTRATIEHCLHVYLSSRHLEATRGPFLAPLPTSRPPAESDDTPRAEQSAIRPETDGSAAFQPAASLPPVVRQGSLEPAEAVKGEDSKFSTDHFEPAPRSPTEADRQGGSDHEGANKGRPSCETVFRPLENYIISCFAGCASLNTSFLTGRPEIQRAASEGQNDRAVPIRSNIPVPGIEPVTSEVEVDAKTLLVGDIAEMSSWWAGDRLTRGQSTHGSGRERSPDSWHGVVSMKSPRLNWAEVASWYRAVLHPEESWRDKWTVLQERSPLPLQAGKNGAETSAGQMLLEIERDLLESADHLKRLLLKVTENLLKRPQKALKQPQDCRFLLIILANPLLLISDPPPPGRRGKPGSSTRRTGPGQHSGIVKRVLGLIAHLPNDLHQFFVSWFSRLPDGHFQRFVDLIGGFVTYRLNRPIQKREWISPTAGLVPSFSDSGTHHASQLHAALSGSRSTSSKPADGDGSPQLANYGDDWQVRAAAKVMALLFAANGGHVSRKREALPQVARGHSAGLTATHKAHTHGQIIPISSFYNTMLDYADLAADFENWETSRRSFAFCQYPFFLSIYAKIRLMDMEARRQMESKAREAFFDSILGNKAVSQFLVLRVRRECLVEDSLRRISEVVGSGQGDIKKGLRIGFVGEEGVDAGGLRKEWFLLLIREVFDEAHGLFEYDEDSRCCYFNAHTFESSEQYFLVGVVTGLAIYNSTILDVAFPPFVFKRLLASTPVANGVSTSTPRLARTCTLEDLAELHPALARGLRQLLEYDGNVQETFCRDFVIEGDRYGEIIRTPLCPGGERIPVTNANRREFVELYIHHLLDSSVSRQYEPFKRGFFTVCGGNALSLFRPEEIELLIRGSDEPLDISTLRAVAVYEGWPTTSSIINNSTTTTTNNLDPVTIPPDQQPQVEWFWAAFEGARPADQRKLLAFITGSDRIPAMGATNLTIKIQLLLDSASPHHHQHHHYRSASGLRSGPDTDRFPTARTCFNTLVLHAYRSREQLEQKLWTAVRESEGFGLK